MSLLAHVMHGDMLHIPSHRCPLPLNPPSALDPDEMHDPTGRYRTRPVSWIGRSFLVLLLAALLAYARLPHGTGAAATGAGRSDSNRSLGGVGPDTSRHAPFVSTFSGFKEQRLP